MADAAFLIGLEKNCDVVPMECYAPLLVNVNPGASQWKTNLIGYDALRSFGSPSYYAQVMLGQNKGDVLLPAVLGSAPKTLFASAMYATAGQTVIVKVVNLGESPVDTAINLRGVASVDPAGTATVLAGDLKAVNTLDEPTKVAPKQETISAVSASFRRTFPPHSFTVLRLTATR